MHLAAFPLGIACIFVEIEEEPEITGNAAAKMLLDAFITSLPHCVNRELIDKVIHKKY